MLVKVRIWFERLSIAIGGLAAAVELFVISAKGLGTSTAGVASLDEIDGMSRSASIVADCGGVFSPRMLLAGRLIEERSTGVRLIDIGVTVVSLSTDFSQSFSRPRIGVEGRVVFSGDLDELMLLMESRLGGPSSMRPRSLTLVGCIVWVRLCGVGLDDTNARSGETSGNRFEGDIWGAFSLALSLSAAWADCIASEVPDREVLGDCGFKGKGAGALSGSELSHLRVVSCPNRGDYSSDEASDDFKNRTYMGIRARPWSDEAECLCFRCQSTGASRSIGGILTA